MMSRYIEYPPGSDGGGEGEGEGEVVVVGEGEGEGGARAHAFVQAGEGEGEGEGESSTHTHTHSHTHASIHAQSRHFFSHKQRSLASFQRPKLRSPKHRTPPKRQRATVQGEGEGEVCMCIAWYLFFYSKCWC